MGETRKPASETKPPQGRDPMTRNLATFRSPLKADWEDAWVGMEPTFQSRKSVQMWHEMASQPGGEDAYFTSKYMLETQREIAEEIQKKYEKKSRDGDKAYCLFQSVKLETELDQWKVTRQNLKFKWRDTDLPAFEVKWTIDPETFEYSIKPVPLVWFYDERFVRFLEEFLWEVPVKHGLTPSIAHGGAQFSLSAKTFLGGSLLADDIATKLNHPELSTWILDWPNPDDRPFRATRNRFAAFRRVLDAYWAGGFHPRAIGTLTAEDVYLDRGWGPAPDPPPSLVNPQAGPTGSPIDVFRNNFAFGRAIRSQAQIVHPGYWQSAHPAEEGYRSDQIGRYSEGNLNRLQICGEFHVKSGKVLDPERIPEAAMPLDPGMLYDEASWENRGQMGRTSARDFVEALLLDVHHARYLQAHPHVRVIPSLLQDQILGDAEATVKKFAGEKVLGRLRAEARKANLEASRNRLKSDWIEPETLFWAAWRALPAGEKAALAREVVTGFVERVEQAASVDRRTDRPPDPMEWHRHRIHPEIWKALEAARPTKKPGDPVGREWEAWNSARDRYRSRRPEFSQTGMKAPWE